MGADDFETRLAPLWARAQTGDEAAYRDALTAIADRLRRYFARRLGASADVEDLVQETLLALHLRRASHRDGAPVANWVHAIAGYKLADFWRRHGRREALHDPVDAVPEALLEAPVEGTGRRDLAALLKILPDAQRDAIVWVKVEGLSTAEAARRSGISVSALKVRIHRGLNRLAALARMPA